MLLFTLIVFYSAFTLFSLPNIFAAAPEADVPSCTVPPDFWCDHPSVALACTGSLDYCTRYMASRRGRPMELKLAFESACPDSQNIITRWLYPKVFSKRELVEDDSFEFKFLPWGLAHRNDDSVRCHHGHRECQGNRLISCAQRHISDGHSFHKTVFCFMAEMRARQKEPHSAMRSCLDGSIRQSSELNQLKNKIISCANNSEADILQKLDEEQTAKVFSGLTHHFVPFMGINGKSHIDMAAMQVVLGEKIQHWNQTVNGHKRFFRQHRNSRSPSLASKCVLPPEFWCSDPQISDECFSQNECQSFNQRIFEQPIQLEVLVSNPGSESSLEYILGYLRAKFYDKSSKKVELLLEPGGVPQTTINRCKALMDQSHHSAAVGKCHEIALQECIAHVFPEPLQKTKQLFCFYRVLWQNLQQQNESHSTRIPSFTEQWMGACEVSITEAENVKRCAQDSEIWVPLAIESARRQRINLWPELPNATNRDDPWVVLNGVSLESVQLYQRVLDRMICQWYRGADHQRKSCSRCEYEPTSCRRG